MVSVRTFGLKEATGSDKTVRVVQLIIYGFWGVFLCQEGIEKFGDFFAAGTGFWSVVMLSVAGLCQLLASTAAIGWAVLGSSTLKAKYLPYKLVNNCTVPVLIIVLAIVASAARSSSDEARAQKLDLKTVKSFLLPVKIIFRMLLITPNLPKNNASKQQKRRLRMLYLRQKKKDRQKRKKLNVSMMLIATLRNIKLVIIFVR